MKELLKDGLNGINEEGDVVAIDHPTWQSPEVFTPDHQWESDLAESFDVPETPLAVSPEKGASVSLRGRAVAIEAIMSYFNQANKRSGLSKSRGYNGFDARYGREANEVAQNMSSKENRLHSEFMRSVESLIARDDLITLGFSPESVDETGKKMVRDLYHTYGPGRAYADERAKLVRKAKGTARKAAGSKR